MDPSTIEALCRRVEAVARSALGPLRVEAIYDPHGGFGLYRIREVVEEVVDPATEVSVGELAPEEGWCVGDEHLEQLLIPTCSLRLEAAVLAAYFAGLVEVMEGADDALAVALVEVFVDQALGSGELARLEALWVHSNPVVAQQALRGLHARALDALTVEPREQARELLTALWARDPEVARRHRAQIADESLVLFEA